MEGCASAWCSSPQLRPGVKAVNVTGDAAVPSDWMAPCTSMSVPSVPGSHAVDQHERARRQRERDAGGDREVAAVMWYTPLQVCELLRVPETT